MEPDDLLYALQCAMQDPGAVREALRHISEADREALARLLARTEENRRLKSATRSIWR